MAGDIAGGRPGVTAGFTWSTGPVLITPWPDTVLRLPSPVLSCISCTHRSDIFCTWRTVIAARSSWNQLPFPGAHCRNWAGKLGKPGSGHCQSVTALGFWRHRLAHRLAQRLAQILAQRETGTETGTQTGKQIGSTWE